MLVFSKQARIAAYFEKIGTKLKIEKILEVRFARSKNLLICK